jgi:hypothetical protein
MWQTFGFPTQSISARQPASQPHTSGANGAQLEDMGINGFGPMGMGSGSGMDMNVNFDDVFGNLGGSSNIYPANDEWSQWMNVGV